MTLLSITYLLATISRPQFLPFVMMLIVIVAFFIMLVSNRMILRRVRQRMSKANTTTSMMQRAMEISANNVVRYSVRERYIYQLYGHVFPEGGVTLDEWRQHVHPDDREETFDWFRQIIHSGLKRAEFSYRWNAEFGGGAPRWRYMHNVSVPEYQADSKHVVNVISTLKDETELRLQEQEESELTSKYKLIFEHSIIGLSFYTPDGCLIDANKMMRDICHFDSEGYDEYFSKTNLFETSPFRECCDPANLQELWICTQSIVPERNIHDYLEIRLHPICDAAGQIVYIAIAARNVTEEREMYLRARLNDAQIQKANEQIRAYEDELTFMMENCKMQAWRISLDRDCIEFYSGLSTIVRSFSLKDMQLLFVNQDDDFVRALSNPAETLSKPLVYVGQMHPRVTQSTTELQWVQVNCIPEYDNDGRLLGSFGLWRNITGLMKKQEQLKRETERANDSGRLKSVFLANMTHEIRTPLNAIVGFSDLLQAIESPDDKREMIRVIHNNCDMLLRLINDILVLSNFDANAMQLVPAWVDFSREFDDICQSLQQRVQEPGVEFLKDNPLPSLVVNIDNGRIQQVITNFVTNAVKYTHQGHIRVGYRLEDGNHLYVYCEDTGTGIPQEKQAAVFERFVKLNDYIQGTGLGLSICKAIVEKCGGYIGVDSEEGKGSTFWFRIPVEVKSEE